MNAPSPVASEDTPWDCLIIGAGPAGLVAATYLGRYRRSACVIDSGDSRAAHIPESHNVPGFPDGIAGPHLLQRLRLQAEAAGAVVDKGCIERIEQEAGVFFAALEGRTLRAHAVLLATGMKDDASIDGLPAQATWRGQVRWCPICDGYESLDKDVIVLGEWAHGPAHALFMRTYTRRLSLVCPPAGAERQRDRDRLAEAGVRLIEAQARRADFDRTGGGSLLLSDGSRLAFDVLYPMTGSHPRSNLALAMGAACDEQGALLVDRHQQTSIHGLYAAGDVVASLKQISVAVSEAALAANAIHRGLPRNFR